jgi:hypothetical protein
MPQSNAQPTNYAGAGSATSAFLMGDISAGVTLACRWKAMWIARGERPLAANKTQAALIPQFRDVLTKSPFLFAEV